ncbi:MAG: hypothetical protein OEZ10_14530 [Gammaproteobacteria bacterium]|nr:hypothetical protein [Gammaproteobacteria bacterium]
MRTRGSVLKLSAGFCLLISASTLSAVDFTSPNDAMPMPSDWRAQPIRYEEPFRKADLVVTLGQQTHPALHQVIREYAAKNKLNIHIETGSCGVSAGRLNRKNVDVAAFCCPPGKTDRLPGLEFHTIGIAPIALITQRNNPIENLSMEEARGIFRGGIREWQTISPLGDNPAHNHINPVGRLHCKVRPGHWHALLDKESDFSPTLFEVGVIQDMLSQVANKPGSIGYETLFMIRHYKMSDKIKYLKIDGMNPKLPEHTLTGRYPMYRTYNLTTWSDKHTRKAPASALVTHLMEHVESEYRNYDFIPVSQLKRHGWKFNKDELIGGPGNNDGVHKP